MREPKEWPSSRDLADARFARFVKDLAHYEREERRREKLDAFLDAYSCWRRTHDEVWRLQMERLADELHDLDARFAFPLKGYSD